MDRIRALLAAEFKKVFVDELTSGGYQVVDFGAADVLVLRPAIINLDVTSPAAAQPAGMGGTFSASAGQATLYLEAYDSVTNEILARVVDPEAGPRHRHDPDAECRDQQGRGRPHPQEMGGHPAWRARRRPWQEDQLSAGHKIWAPECQ